MNATTAILSLFVAATAACGAPDDPNAPRGICYDLEPVDYVWRPCEAPDQIRADGKTCKIHILDRVEYHYPSETTTCAECYSVHGETGSCD